MADEKVALDSNRESLIAEVEKRLDFNVRAYGTAWNGERGDTEFVLAPLLAANARVPHREAGGSSRHGEQTGASAADGRGDAALPGLQQASTTLQHEATPSDASAGVSSADRPASKVAYSRGRGRKPTRAKQLGVTDDEYARLLAAQDGHCALCPNRPKTRRLHVDHDHATGTVRGLLCHRCNRALPTWITPRWLDEAWMYLNRTTESMAQARLRAQAQREAL